MKDSLLKSALFVWFFWWTVFFLFSDYKTLGNAALFPSFFNGLALALVACLIGLSIRLIFVYLDIKSIRDSLADTNFYGLKTTLAGLPPVKQLPRAKSFTIPGDLIEWFNEYRAQYPKYAAIFEAVLLTYESTPIPASPVKGGHGGLNLKEHSFNVLREILRARRNFSYVGSKTKDGNIRQGLTDINYKFNQADPAIPLLGFIHDVGKMNCYKLKRNGEVEEIKMNHDVQGSKLLVSLPEFRELTNDNQSLKNRLSVIMAYYHHPVEMPLWADDHTRALTELLIIADNAASKKEGGYKADYTSEIKTPEGDVSVPSGWLEVLAEGEAETVQLLAKEIGLGRLEQLDAVVDLPPNEPALVTKEQTAAKYVKKEESKSKTPGFNETNIERKVLLLGEKIFKALKEQVTRNSALLDPSEKENSIGFVKDGLFYFQDLAVRKHLQLVFGDSAFTKDRSGQQNKYSFALLAYLMSKEWLYCVHEGLNYSSKRAYFNIVKTTRVKNKPVNTTIRYMFIVNDEAFYDESNSQRIQDTKLGISIAGPSWGENSDFKLKDGARNVEISKDVDDELFLASLKEDGEVELKEIGSPELSEKTDGNELPLKDEVAAELDAPSNENLSSPDEVIEDATKSDDDAGGDIQNNDDEDFISPEDRLGILAVIAKLQYSNNKKLKPGERRLVNDDYYLYYKIDDVCLKFHYTEDDLLKDMADFRDKHGKKKIGTQRLSNGSMGVYIKESEITT